jgi:hypothetical protein
MVEDSDQSDPPTKTVGYGGVIPLGGSRNGFLVCFNLVVRTRGLMIGSYSAYQTELSDRIIRLRDSEGLTYRAIANLLIEEGYRSPRGFDLGPESVFSIYKKRKKRDTRLNGIPEVEIEDLQVLRFLETD